MKNDASRRQTPRRPRWQFSLRSILVATTIVAVLLGLGALAGPLFAYIASVAATVGLMVLASAIAAGLVYGRGDVRAFCLGAGAGIGALLLTQGWSVFSALLGGARSLGGFASFATWLAVHAAGVVAAGITSVFLRRRLVGREP